MAGGKKKKKPAANPARGFATTSIASKPRLEATEEPKIHPQSKDAASPAAASATSANDANTLLSKDSAPPLPTTFLDAQKDVPRAQDATTTERTLSPEEFERHLEESELQLLVEKHSQKVKRDAHRQCTRLETDRRLLRASADPINSPKWLPEDLMAYILNLVEAESRFVASSISSDAPGKMPSEEDMITRLWTLQQTLTSAGFPEDRNRVVIRYILDIAPNITTTGKDLIWGLEEALEWLARECDTTELPAYEKRQKPVLKETPNDSPASTRPSTPKPNGHNKGAHNHKFMPPKKLIVSCDKDFEPDELLPAWVAAQKSLLELQRDVLPEESENFDKELAIAKSEACIRKIESDPLFYEEAAREIWKKERVVLEKQIAAIKKESKELPRAELASKNEKKDGVSMGGGDVNDEAERIAAEILAQSEDGEDDLGGLFDALPQEEVDASTGKTQNVITSSDGERIVIRDFGKWSGLSPRRILEESCRSRDSSVKVNFSIVSESSFANRHSVEIRWSKPQEIPTTTPDSDVEVIAEAQRVCVTMSRVATSDLKQSEAYVATSALFHIFSFNAREEKASLRLPHVWRDLFAEFAATKKEYLDAQDRNVVRELRVLVRERRDQELEDGVILQGAFRGRGAAKGIQDSSDSSSQDQARTVDGGSDQLRNIWSEKSASSRYQTMLQSRMQLPMWTFKDQVLNAVDQNQVVIVCGETGCGKSTQVPAFLLEHQLSQGKQCKIYCTEPRRISAISLARRVSEELGEGRRDLGTSRSLVGYSIRLEANTSRETRLIYATTGIVMRMLEGSNDLHDITHLVLDEVHERSIDSDFLLIVLKRLLKKRGDLKVVLMSATVDADRFSSYLGGAPVLNVPGRTFPVEVRYLEDAVELTHYQLADTPSDRFVDLDDDAIELDEEGQQSEHSKALSKYSASTRATLAQMDEYCIEPDLIVQLIAKISSASDLQNYSKAILIFLPGIAEIRTLNDLLLGDPRFAKGWLIYPLHSTIATEDQEAAFLVPEPGIRKIVLATNIAETGITIPDVTCVIDTGKHREMRYDERRQMSRLIDTFISRANAKQRRGRAGRVQQGLCFHMFTKYRHDNLMNDQQTPEMLRLSLQDLAIRVKICKIGGIEETLGDALDPPSSKNIRRAVDALVDVRALTAGEDLTPLGHQLARLPLDVFLGKLILLGTVFKCLDMAITVAAILSSKSPFTAPFGQRAQAQNAKMLFKRGDSDLLTIYNAYLSWKRVCQANSGFGKDFQFCRKNFLSQQTLANIEDLKGQLMVSLADSGFLSLTEEERKALSRARFASGGRGRKQNFFEVPRRVNVNSDNDVISASVISWSFYPKLLVRDTPGSRGLRNVGNNQNISLHPSSVNRSQLDIKWLSYYHIMQAKSSYNAHETTAVEPFAVALLCGDVRCDMFSGVLTLDGNRGRFVVPDWKTMLVVKVLRTRLRELLTRTFKQPGKLPTAQQEKWLEVWQRLFSQDFGQDRATSAIKT